MAYGWTTRGGLAPMRMFPMNDNTPKYEIRKIERRMRLILREWMDIECMRPGPRIDSDRSSRQQFPGKLGEWPVYRYGKRKRKPKIKNGRRWRR